MNKPLKIIYIASLSHSGSTMLGIMLGSLPEATCLGEIMPSLLYGKGQSDTCTCGSNINSCAVWANFINRHVEEKDYLPVYLRLIENALSVSKSETIIDTSKCIKGLSLLLKSNELEIKVIWLLKDIRSFVHSQLSRIKRKELIKKDGWRRIYTTTALYNILHWRIGNGKILRFLTLSDIPFIKIGYEELCFRTETIMQKIASFTGLKYNTPFSPLPEKNHMARGNRLRVESDKEELIIRYDYGWMKNPRIGGISFLMMPFYRWNTKHVYSNSEPQK